MSWDVNKVMRAVEDAKTKAAKISLNIVGEAASQEVPLDEGTLKESLFIDVINGVGVISFGGGTGTGDPVVPYAIRHHEVPANFQRGRKSQFLRDPFNRLAQKSYEKALENSI